MRRLRPEHVAQLAALGRAQAVQREAKRNANEPAAEAVAIPEAIEAAIRAQERFLRNILGIGGIAENAARHAIGKWTALSEPCFELASCLGLGSLARRLFP